MSVTARQLIYQAIRDVCVLRAGQPAPPDIENDCFTRLNQMIDAWLIDRFLVFAINATTYPLTVGQQQYQIGPGAADFNVARPTKIEDANIILNTVNPVVRQPVSIIDFEQWSRIRVQVLPNAIPQVLYDDYNFPISTLNLWPGPQSGYGLELFTWIQLTKFADLNITTYSFPPGYERMLRSNLAIEIVPSLRVYFKTPQPMVDAVARVAMQSKEELRSYNAPDPIVPVDEALLCGNRSGSWNWLTGQVGRGSCSHHKGLVG